MKEIYEEYSKTIYKYLLSLTNNVEIAEELLQETFYSAVKNINKFRGNSNIKNWFIKLLKINILITIRKIKKWKK